MLELPLVSTTLFRGVSATAPAQTEGHLGLLK